MLGRMLKAMWPRRRADATLADRALHCYRIGDYPQAEALLETALARAPRDARVLTRLALVKVAQYRAADAAALLERALEADPSYTPARCQYAGLHRSSGRLGDAISHYRAAVDANPESIDAAGELLHALLDACDWDGADALAARLRECAARAPSQWMASISPMTALYLKLDPEVCRAVAEYHADLYARDLDSPVSHERTLHNRPERLRIGYFSGDFRDHAVGRLLYGAFGLHDRSRFETFAFSFGPADSGHYRSAIAASVDCFIDVGAQDDAAAARTIAKAGIDILIDLMGHTEGNRLGVLARRAAPVQAHFVGYPATTGARYVDYFVTDRIVTPAAPQRHFTETLAEVPDCYMLSDGAEARDLAPDARAAHGLPEDAYVYANFSSASRLDRDTFMLWLRILDAVPGSVLWLLAADPLVEQNLRRYAGAGGVDPARLVFAKRESRRRAHLSRLGCADLALDTLGWYNGHTTSVDMLWAGVPVLTAIGDTFATRVAASLITAAGLPELASATWEEYAQTAIALGRDRVRTRGLHERLRDARSNAPFFQTERLVRGLEGAYDAMYSAKAEGRSAPSARDIVR